MDYYDANQTMMIVINCYKAYLATERGHILVQRGKLIVEPLDRAPDVLLHGFLRDHLGRPSSSYQDCPARASAFPVILPDGPNEINFIRHFIRARRLQSEISRSISSFRRESRRENPKVRNSKVDYVPRRNNSDRPI